MPIAGRIAIQQRVLPEYRGAFFDVLSAEFPDGLSVFAGRPQPSEAIETATQLNRAIWSPANNVHLFSGRFYLCWQRGLLRWLEQWDPRVLVLEANPRYLRAGQALRWMKSRNRPVIGWGLGAPSIQGKSASFRDQMRWDFIHRFDGMITYSQRGAAEYQALGYPPDRIWVAPNAVSHSPTWPLPARAPEFKGQPIVLFVGRLQARKRIDYLLMACAGLPETLQPKLWIVGDGPAREQYQAMAAEVYPRAEFIGARYGDDLVRYFINADLLVLPGTGGLAIQQAISYGLPVIAAEADGTQADIVRPDNGWRVKPGNLQDLTMALREALSNPARLRQMGSASYQIATNEVNLEKMVSVFMRAISTCLSDK